MEDWDNDDYLRNRLNGEGWSILTPAERANLRAFMDLRLESVIAKMREEFK